MKLSDLGHRMRDRFDVQRRTGDVTITSVVVCAGILLFSILQKYFEG